MRKQSRSTWFAAVLFAGLATLAPAALHAQATITGRVTTEHGTPVLGATVDIAAMSITTATDAAGRYTITIPAGRVSGQEVVVRARSIGLKAGTKPLTLTSGTHAADFTLTRDVTELSAIVATGVAAATEQIKVPFSVTRLDTTAMPVMGRDALSQLQGKIPGALIVGGTGRPGSEPSIVLRGPVSLDATGRSQSPLFLLDGVPLQGGLPDINPADIEKIEVLKGAAAASIYGARAGAGVINITTKSGRNAPPGVRFSIRSEWGKGDIEGEFQLARRMTLSMDPTASLFCSREVIGGSPCGRYIDWDAEVQRINNSGEDFSRPPQLFLNDIGLAAVPSYDQLTGTFQVNSWPTMRDPVGQLVTPSAFGNTNIDVRAKIGNTGVYASFGNSTQQGAVRFLSGYRRNSARVNVDQNFGDRVSATVNTFYAQTRDDGANFDNTTSFAPTWFNLTRAPWMQDGLARDGLGRVVVRANPLTQGVQNYNPAYSLAYSRREDRGTRFVGGATVRYTPFDWLNVDGNISYDRATGIYTQMRDRGWRVTSSAPVTSAGNIFQGSKDDEQLTTSLNASATRELINDLNTTFTARYVYSDQVLRSQDLGGDALVTAGLETARAATTNLAIESSKANIRDVGIFGGVDFDFKDRYQLGVLLRRDGSSLFGAGNRWQTFGRVAGAWIGSREDWWNLDAVSLFKLRASRGSTGQRPRFTAQYETFAIGTGGQLNPLTVGNKNLKPEINTETELGTDMEILGKYGLSVSYAKAVIDGQILPVRAPTATGFQQQWQNAGEITNKTWEATLTVPIIDTRRVSWTTRLIYDRTKSVISRLDVPEFVGTITPNRQSTVTNGSPTPGANFFDIFKFRQGEQIGTIWGFDYVRSCGQLPAAFVSQCSMSAGDASAAYRPNSDGMIVWVGAGNELTQGITGNLWRTRTGLGQGPWGNNSNWGMPITLRDSASNIAFVPVGNGLPKFHWGWSHTIDFNRFSLYGLLDSYVGQKAWNVGYHWSLGDFQTGVIDQAGASVEDARPVGYYWRRGPSTSPGGNTGVGGLYDALNPSTVSVQDASYSKLREVSLSYHVGPVAGNGDWKVTGVGRNLHTWSKWAGFDPEGGNFTGPFASAALTPVNGYRFPNLRTFTLMLSTSY